MTENYYFGLVLFCFFLSLRCCVFVGQMVEQQDKEEHAREEMVELMSWNPSKKNHEDDTQVYSQISMYQRCRTSPALTQSFLGSP